MCITLIQYYVKQKERMKKKKEWVIPMFLAITLSELLYQCICEVIPPPHPIFQNAHDCLSGPHFPENYEAIKIMRIKDTVILLECIYFSAFLPSTVVLLASVSVLMCLPEHVKGYTR